MVQLQILKISKPNIMESPVVASVVSTGAVSVVTGAVSSTAAVSVTAASTGAGDSSFAGTSGATSLLVEPASLLEPVRRWKLPEIRRDHPFLGRLVVSSPESAPSSSDVTASGDFV